MKAWSISEMFSLTKVNKHALINLLWFVPLNKNSCKSVLPTLRKVIRYWFFFFFYSFLTGLFYSYTIIFTLPPWISLFFLSALLFCANLRPFFFFFLNPPWVLTSVLTPLRWGNCSSPTELPFFGRRQILARRKSCDLETKAMSFWFANLVVLAGLHNEAGKLSR